MPCITEPEACICRRNATPLPLLVLPQQRDAAFKTKQKGGLADSKARILSLSVSVCMKACGRMGVY
jgi:hypothetical protein